MTTYDGDLVLPRRRGPAFGQAATLPRTDEKEPESRGPLTKRVEAALGLAIIAPTLAGYAALAYGCYLAVKTLWRPVWISVVLLLAGVLLVLLVPMRS